MQIETLPYPNNCTRESQDARGLWRYSKYFKMTLLLWNACICVLNFPSTKHFVKVEIFQIVWHLSSVWNPLGESHDVPQGDAKALGEPCAMPLATWELARQPCLQRSQQIMLSIQILFCNVLITMFQRLNESWSMASKTPVRCLPSFLDSKQKAVKSK